MYESLIYQIRSWYGSAGSGDGGDGSGGGSGDGGTGDGGTGGTGDGGTGGSGGTGDGSGGGAGSGEGGEGGEKTFTQTEVNSIMAQNRRTLQAKVTELTANVAELKAGSLTAEEKVVLTKRIKELNDQLLTKEELAKQESEQLKTESAAKIETLEKQLNSVQERYTSESIQRAITDAAATNDAFAPDQIVAIMRPNTSLVEELDKEGNPTGNLIAKTKLTGKDKDGKETVLDLTVADAVKMMKDMPERYGNLFKSTATGGMGGGSSASGTGGGKVDVGSLSTEEYIAKRKKGEIDLTKV